MKAENTRARDVGETSFCPLFVLWKQKTDNPAHLYDVYTCTGSILITRDVCIRLFNTWVVQKKIRNYVIILSVSCNSAVSCSRLLSTVDG